LHIDERDPGVSLGRLQDGCRALDANGPILGRDKGIAENGGFGGIGREALGCLPVYCLGGWLNRWALGLSEYRCGAEQKEAGDDEFFHGVAFYPHG